MKRQSPRGNALSPVVGSTMWTVHWDLILASGALLSLAAMGVWAVVKVRKWREEHAEEVAPTRAEQLGPYQKMLDDGLLDLKEYGHIIKTQLDIAPPTPPANDTEPPSADQPPDASIRE